MFPLYFPQVANEYIKYVLFVSYVASWRTVDNFNEARATSLPSSTVDRSTGEDNIIIF